MPISEYGIYPRITGDSFFHFFPSSVWEKSDGERVGSGKRENNLNKSRFSTIDNIPVMIETNSVEPT